MWKKQLLILITNLKDNFENSTNEPASSVIAVSVWVYERRQVYVKLKTDEDFRNYR